MVVNYTYIISITIFKLENNSKLLIQKKVDFKGIPYDNSNAIIPWFMDMLKNPDNDEKHEIIEILKNPNQTKQLS